MSKMFGFMKKDAKGSENFSEPTVSLTDDNMPFLDSNDGELNLDEMLGEELTSSPLGEPHFNNSDVDLGLDKWNETTEDTQAEENPLAIFDDEEPVQVSNSWLESGNEEVAESETILNGSWLDAGEVDNEPALENIDSVNVAENNNSWFEEKEEPEFAHSSFEKEETFFEQDRFLADNLRTEQTEEDVVANIDDEPEVDFVTELEDSNESVADSDNTWQEDSIFTAPENDVEIVEETKDSFSNEYEADVSEPFSSPFAEEAVSEAVIEPTFEIEEEASSEFVFEDKIEDTVEVENDFSTEYEPEITQQFSTPFEEEAVSETAFVPLTDSAEETVDFYEAEVDEPTEPLSDFSTNYDSEVVEPISNSFAEEPINYYEPQIEKIVETKTIDKDVANNTLGFVKWYSGSLYDSYFEVSKTSVSETIIGDEANKAIHVNVGSDTYGWNVEFASGLQMSLRDVRTYQLRNGSLPETNGCITYGNVRIEFVNIERINIYETVEYFSY